MGSKQASEKAVSEWDTSFGTSYPIVSVLCHGSGRSSSADADVSRLQGIVIGHWALLLLSARQAGP